MASCRRTLCLLLAVLVLIGVVRCSAVTPKSPFETGYSAVAHRSNDQKEAYFDQSIFGQEVIISLMHTPGKSCFDLPSF
jgi:hypothetical protein